MTTVDANSVRIPAAAREALMKHEEVVVLNHGRPTYVILTREDYERSMPTMSGRRRRTLAEALEILSSAPLPDTAFAADMEAVLAAVGAAPADPWERS